MKTTHYDDMTRKQFESFLFLVNGEVPILRASILEDGKRVFLYYGRLKENRCGLNEHIGTYCGGRCWTFDAPIDRLMEYRGAKHE